MTGANFAWQSPDVSFIYDPSAQDDDGVRGYEAIDVSQMASTSAAFGHAIAGLAGQGGSSGAGGHVSVSDYEVEEPVDEEEEEVRRLDHVYSCIY